MSVRNGGGSSNNSELYPGRDASGPRNYRAQPVQKPYDPTEDDPLDHSGSIRSAGASGSGDGQSHYVVAPSIQVRAEFSSLARTNDSSQPLTCIVVIELPGKRLPSAGAPGSAMTSVNYGSNGTANGRLRREPSNLSQQISNMHSQHPSPHSSYHAQQHQNPQAQQYDQHQYQQGGVDPHRGQSNSGYNSPNPLHMSSGASSVHQSNYEPSVISSGANDDNNSPFNAITEDLRNRIVDWRGHPLSDLGPLTMYDLLAVRRDSLVRELFVYLFREAIICVVEEKKRSLGRLLSGASSFSTDASSVNGSSYGGQSKGVLRLRGRIYVRHIRTVTASSAAGEMSLTIDMEDELASFILIFKDKSTLDAWKNSIQNLVDSFKHNQHQSVQSMQSMQSQSRSPEPGSSKHNMGLEEFGGSSKAMRVLSGSTQTTVSTVDSLLHRSTMSSVSSHGSTGLRSSQMHNQMQQQQAAAKLGTLGEQEEDEMAHYDSPTSMVTPYTASSGPSNSLTPLPHPPMDLMLVISVPPPTAVLSTAQLKLRVIRNTCDFILNSMSSKDRLSLVTFEVGFGGRVRKTPFLSPAKAQSRARLNKFVENTGLRNGDDTQDEFLVRGSKEEKTDVVTAVNHGELIALLVC